MGPKEQYLKLARFLIAENIVTGYSDISLGYILQDYAERNGVELCPVQK